MKAIGYDQPGDPARPHRIELPTPEPELGQVRVRVAACGINPVDVKLSRAGFAGWEWPHIPGIDVVGEVDAVGAGVPTGLIGTRVAGHHNLKLQGGMAEFVCVDANMIAAVPDSLDQVTAAAVPCPGLTAHQAINRSHVAAGQSVLITGAGGAVGTFAVQLALRSGAVVDALSSAHDLFRLRALGVRTAVDYRDPQAIDSLRSAEPAGYDVVLDLATPATLTAPLARYGGVVASTVSMPDLSAVPPFTTVPAAIELALGAIYWYGSVHQRQDLGRALARLLADVAKGSLEPPPTVSVSFDEVPAIWGELVAGQLPGKIVAMV